MKLLKLALGSAVSILLADALGLKYSTAAGIITLLTIQNTSKETIVISAKRVAAFLLGTLLAFVVFQTVGYHAVSFGIFLLLFIACCQFLKLEAAVSTNAVLVTHYLLEGNMAPSLIINEMLLVLIGAGIGTLLNLYIPGKTREIRTSQHMLEEDLRAVLLRMSEYIKKEDKSDYSGSCFDKLLTDITHGEEQAFAYMNNTLFQESKYFIHYMEMRRQQCTVLKDIYKKIVSMKSIPPQAEPISAFFHEIGTSFGESNNAKDLIRKLDFIFSEMKTTPLPSTREEFEDRAVLYVILMDLKYFLRLKEEFSESLSADEVRRYWN